MATAEQYASWIVQNKDKQGTPEFETVAAAYKAARAQMNAGESPQTVGQSIKQGVGNVGAGLIRGAGSIGATLLAPIDAAARAAGVQNEYIGRTDRRASMDAALQGLGAQPESMLYQAGKLGAEVAGTLGAGGAVANTVGRVAPSLANAPILTAVRTGGMSTGLSPVTLGQRAADMGGRMVGGGVSGAASAGLVNPEDATSGGAIGAVAPGAFKAAGAAGQKVGNIIRGPAQSADMAASINAARSAGYVIPPTQANPTLANRVLEGLSGKITTAQNASAKNQAVTNSLASEALGLAKDTKLTPDVLKAVRDKAGQAYEAIGQTGTITPGAQYTQALDAIAAPFAKAAQGFPGAKPSPVIDLVESLKSPSFDASSAVAKIRELRTAADDAFRSGNTDIARASKGAAKALEDALDQHVQGIGSPDLLAQFRDARQLIAKTYSVEKALNPASGSVDARKLASQLQKGKPLSGDLKQAAEFAARFPKAAQAVEGMGSLPQTSPLDWAVGSGLSAATSNPLMMAGVVARPAARAAILSPVVQNRLIQSQPNALARMLANQEFQKNALRAAPVAISDR